MIKRFDFTINGIVEAEGGNYVLHDDYDTVRIALLDLVADLEARSEWKGGADQGIVNCGNGVYMQAKRALNAQTAINDKELGND